MALVNNFSNAVMVLRAVSDGAVIFAQAPSPGAVERS